MNLPDPPSPVFYTAHRFSIHFKCYRIHEYYPACLRARALERDSSLKLRCLLCEKDMQFLSYCYFICTWFIHCVCCVMLFVLLFLVVDAFINARISKHIICRCCQLKLSQLFISIYFFYFSFRALKRDSSIRAWCAVQQHSVYLLKTMENQHRISPPSRYFVVGRNKRNSKFD